MNIQAHLQSLFKAHTVTPVETLQELWSGYGSIVRFALLDASGKPCKPSSVIVKSIRPPITSNHPRGWNTDRSHQRKLKSYEVESHWYQDWADQCTDLCKVAHCYSVFSPTDDTGEQQTCIVLEDLDASGYNLRANDLTSDLTTTLELCRLCLNWLAHFHATFLCKNTDEPGSNTNWPEGLWPTGTYWHLETRPDEFERMADSPLKRHAHVIGERLNACTYKTLVHGDAKVDNFCIQADSACSQTDSFCINAERKAVAAVDFQYIGGGCGMKDVIYCMGSCLDEHECEQHHQALLDGYFQTLTQAIAQNPQHKNINLQLLEAEWRQLFPLAWADFHRFILGWAPHHAKNNKFSDKITATALLQLD